MHEYRFGFIGNTLALKTNIKFNISKQGRIINLSYDECKNEIKINRSNNNYLLVPGLINSHTHIFDSFAKERGYNKDLVEVVAPPDGLKHQLLRRTPTRFKKEGVRNAISDMISNGITCFMDFREEGIKGVHILKNVLKNSPIQRLIFGRFNSLDEIEQIFKEADGIGLSSYKSIDDSIKKALTEKKDQYKKSILCHHAEVKRKEKRFNKILNDKLIDLIVHGTQLKINDLKALQDENISLVICPRSNGYFGVGFPPIKEIVKLNIPVSIGTDNFMVNSPDLFEEIRYLYMIFKLSIKENINLTLTAKELLKMITINAAKNFKIESDIGSVKEGKSADFFLIDLNTPNFYVPSIQKEHIYSLIVQRSKPHNIKKVYIKGEKAFERK
jgi:cytosine/adenosine deaminase-related metal-dependent hydrolase